MSEFQINKVRETTIIVNETNKDTIRECLDSILKSNIFGRSYRIKTFLLYIVDESLEGRAALLKEYSIAVDVFGKGEFTNYTDDSVVRTSANRLRLMLGQYYATIGTDDVIRIEIPKGSYIPQFYAIERVDDGLEPASSSTSLQREEPLFLPDPHWALNKKPQNILASRPAQKWIVGLSFCLALSALIFSGLWASQEEDLRILVRNTSMRGLVTQEEFEFKNYLISHLLEQQQAQILDPNISLQKTTGKLDYFLDVELFKSGTNTSIVSMLVEARSNRIVWMDTVALNGSPKNLETASTNLAQRVTIEALKLRTND